MTISTFTKPDGKKLTYVYTPPQTNQSLPTVMFLGGFKSDMTGSKAVYLEEFCAKRGQGFVRFDYSGHGASQGDFVEGTIGSWMQDAQYILEQIIKGDVLLVGSSMGGWISLLLMLRYPERVKGMIGIAAAPDFTQEVTARMNAQQRQEMQTQGYISVPSAYEEPYIYTRQLVEEGQKHFLLQQKHNISKPLILLQGKRDEAVYWQTALKIKDAFQGPMTEILFIEDGDHRLSRDQDLKLLGEQIERLSGV